MHEAAVTVTPTASRVEAMLDGVRKGHQRLVRIAAHLGWYRTMSLPRSSDKEAVTLAAGAKYVTNARTSDRRMRTPADDSPQVGI
jgi:hypothetical protein